jgi:RNA-directed DNA polymerase
MAREYPTVQFERYADDVVVHCVSEAQAKSLVVAIRNRLAKVGLRLNPATTRIVYCKDGRRRLDHEQTAFSFLGLTFRARGARGKNGRNFTGFLPAVSKDALNKMSREVRRWRLHLLTGHALADLARKINPIARGWMRYYGAYYRTVLDPLLARINAYLMRWIRRKYQRLRPLKKALACWQRITRQQPRLFCPLGMEGHTLVTKTTRAR